MLYKFLLVSLFLFLNLSTFSQQHYSSTADGADAWIAQFLCNSDGTLRESIHDINIICNLLYLSFQRSSITLKAQKHAVELLRVGWQGWQNVAQRRRNPSKPIPHPAAAKSLPLHADDFYLFLQEHERISSAYDTLLEQVLKQDILENHFLKMAIEEIREESRTAVTHALLNVQSHIIELSEYIKTKRSLAIDDIEQEIDATRSQLVSYLQENIPLLAFNSFAKADNLFIKTSQMQWETLITSQELSNIVWESVEKARAEFYHAYYRAVYEKLQILGLAPCNHEYPEILLPAPATLAVV